MEIKSIQEKNIEEILSEIIKLYKESYKELPQYSYIEDKKIKKYIKWLIKRDSNGNFTLEHNDNIIGYLAIDTNWYSKIERERVGAIHEIFIKPEYKHQGLGKKLYEKAEQKFKEKKINLIEAWVGEKNSSAILFFESCGFESKNKRWDNWIRMIKKI